MISSTNLLPLKLLCRFHDHVVLYIFLYAYQLFFFNFDVWIPIWSCWWAGVEVSVVFFSLPVYSMISAKNRSSIHRKKAKIHVIKVILLDYGIFTTALCEFTENHDFNIPINTFDASMLGWTWSERITTKF